MHHASSLISCLPIAIALALTSCSRCGLENEAEQTAQRFIHEFFTATNESAHHTRMRKAVEETIGTYQSATAMRWEYGNIVSTGTTTTPAGRIGKSARIVYRIAGTKRSVDLYLTLVPDADTWRVDAWAFALPKSVIERIQKDAPDLERRRCKTPFDCEVERSQ